ncbi:MAG TPA: nuclease-related domain-containing protein [Lacunisphaera sp.]
MATWFIVGIEALYFAAVVASILFLRHRRKTRWPFKAEDKLLRGPGEELRRKLLELDERLAVEVICGILGSLLLFAMGLSLGGKILHLSPFPMIGVAFASPLIAVVISCVRLAKVWQERQNLFLGWFGERYTAEFLEPVKLTGCRIFHDVPFSNDGKKFNIDHVAIGSGGVFCIETKTRRKGNPRPGFADNKVFFDGRDLVWPWAEDNHGLEQAERNALWLTNWIRTEIGERVHVSPILALPGWWLEKKPARETRLCQVVNPKWLPGMLDKQPAILSPKQVELISLRFEARCRDVEE